MDKGSSGFAELSARGFPFGPPLAQTASY